MENNIDNILTKSLKKRLNSMKKQDQKNTPVTDAITMLILGVGKYLVMSLLIWWGWNTIVEVFAVPSLSYLQIVSIIICFRSIGVALIDPIVSNLKPKKD